jgi:hypothetical protein
LNQAKPTLPPLGSSSKAKGYRRKHSGGNRFVRSACDLGALAGEEIDLVDAVTIKTALT